MDRMVAGSMALGTCLGTSGRSFAAGDGAEIICIMVVGTDEGVVIFRRISDVPSCNKAILGGLMDLPGASFGLFGFQVLILGILLSF
jgi:hypothetical protein